MAGKKKRRQEKMAKRRELRQQCSVELPRYIKHTNTVVTPDGKRKKDTVEVTRLTPEYTEVRRTGYSYNPKT